MTRTEGIGVVFSVVIVAGILAMGCAPAEEPVVTTEVEVVTEPAVAEVPTGADGALDAAELVGAWKLESLSGEPVAEDFDTTLEFTEDGRLGGSAGCNNYGGDYRVENGVLTLPIAFAATKKMCPPPMMEQEDAYLQALAGYEHATIAGDTLKVFFADSDEPLVFSRVVAEEAEH